MKWLLVAMLVAQTAPYSCRLLYDAQKQCAMSGQNCDQRVIDRLTRECLRDNGRP